MKCKCKLPSKISDGTTDELHASNETILLSHTLHK